MSKLKTYDLICLGGGSAGFNAARVAADLGRKVAVVDGARELGGLCILRGCMPSKTLIFVAETLHAAQHADRLGLRVPRAHADMAAVHRRKKRLIAEFAAHRLKALEDGRFDLYHSNGRFFDAHTIELADGRRIRGRKFLIGTGSKVDVPPVPGLREARFWTSDDVLELDFVPRSVLVLGGGIVACELAQFLNRIGSRVTLIQRSRNILRDHSEEASQVVQKAFVDEGIELLAGTQILGLTQTRRETVVRFQHDGKVRTRRAAHLFNALGRAPNTGGLGLENAGVKLSPHGRIRTNRWQQSSAPHIYAAGDCAGPADIVHVAIQQAEVAARHAFRVRGVKPVDYSLLLNVVFTDPQLATVGLLERDLDERGVPYLTASYPFDDHGKSILMEAKRGYVKVLAEPTRGRILGAEIVGRDAGELIHSLAVAIAHRATVHSLLKSPWYHPTLSEIITYPLEGIAEKLRR
ncbi:MAG TPA: dihydrolipoyl dehydrogenase [Candidatus Didemnitutus sp.]|jgi:pyruvate/2-oxoglutarate dehydrogenase complex dihydrolipoamide dehydrogenase (E3) component